MARRPPARPPAAPTPPDPAAEFRAAVAGARPLRVSPRASARPVPPPPVPRFTRQAEVEVLADSLSLDADVLEVDGAEHLSWAAAGVQHGLLRRLRRGLIRCDAELDLHGLTAARARLVLLDFLREAERRGWRCLRVVHGKGLGSGPGGPVLKTRVAAWLRRDTRVLAYTSARAVDGGTGALQVLLRAA